jgi:hypothetical protein
MDLLDNDTALDLGAILPLFEVGPMGVLDNDTALDPGTALLLIED